jgi:hypothetical protein
MVLLGLPAAQDTAAAHRMQRLHGVHCPRLLPLLRPTQPPLLPLLPPLLLPVQFHAQGRAPVFAYSNSFCEGGANGTGLYYLASAADKVFMPPTGMLSLLGFASSQVCVRGLFWGGGLGGHQGG